MSKAGKETFVRVEEILPEPQAPIYKVFTELGSNDDYWGCSIELDGNKPMIRADLPSSINDVTITRAEWNALKATIDKLFAWSDTHHKKER